jgi:hypothetical protein
MPCAVHAAGPFLGADSLGAGWAGRSPSSVDQPVRECPPARSATAPAPHSPPGPQSHRRAPQPRHESFGRRPTSGRAKARFQERPPCRDWERRIRAARLDPPPTRHAGGSISGSMAMEGPFRMIAALRQVPRPWGRAWVRTRSTWFRKQYQCTAADDVSVMRRGAWAGRARDQPERQSLARRLLSAGAYAHNRDIWSRLSG